MERKYLLLFIQLLYFMFVLYHYSYITFVSMILYPSHIKSSTDEWHSLILHVLNKFKCTLSSTGWQKLQPVWLKSTLKARSVWPQTCLDLLYLDRGPHPVQSLQSVCPGMPPLTAILLWNNRELFGKGGKINTPSVDYPPAILGPLDPLCVQSIKDPSEMSA